MEYREPFDTFYREVIKPQAEKLYEIVRIDEKSGPGVIFQDMQREIGQSDVVIAEITPANPNVFYELGYAQALGKPTILLAQRGAKLPLAVSRASKRIWPGTWTRSANPRDKIRHPRQHQSN